MKLYLASKRGFCQGVKRAVDLVSDTLSNSAGGIYVLKEIVHNKAVIERFKNQGVEFLESVENLHDAKPLVLPAHGVSPKVRETATHLTTKLGTKLVDATCPLVDFVHIKVRDYLASGYQIIYIGHRGHDEVDGVLGESDDIFLLESLDTFVDEYLNAFPTTHTADSKNADAVIYSAQKQPINYFDTSRKTVWLSQTTLSVDDTNEIVKKLHKLLPNLEDPDKECICLATKERQTAARELASAVGNDGLIIVVGSKNSSNSVRLADLTQTLGVKTLQVDGLQDLDIDYVCSFESVGITSGASVPDDIVQEIIRAMGVAPIQLA